MLKQWDDRRDYIIAGDTKETLDFAAEHWIHCYERAVQRKGRFAVALSGGSTPKAIYERLGTAKLDGSKIWLFWSDERAVPPNHAESNYRLAMESGLSKLNVPQAQIFRMVAEKEIEKNALDYEEKIGHYLDKHLFDLVMLGVGEDGHTASLFPQTAALEVKNHLVAPNYISEKNTWRMTLTFPCINGSAHSAIYAIGPSKKQIVPKVLNAAILSDYPASRIGVPTHKTLWVLDKDASQLL